MAQEILPFAERRASKKKRCPSVAAAGLSAKALVGLGGMAGAIGGMLISKVVGWILTTTGSYVPIFIIAGSAYMLALLIIHLLVPKLEPARLA